MDADLKQAESHIILPVERLGDTLLVSPHGDLGSYSAHTFHAEFQHVQKLVAQPRIRNLIIDLSGSRYFGSEMMGALLALREPIVEAGGRVALVNASEDTKVGLSLIKADTLFEVMGTRSEAIRKVAQQTVGDRVHRNRHALRWGAALLFLVGGSWWLYASQVGFQVFGSRPVRAYEEIARQWQRYENGQKSWTSEEARTYSAEIVDELESIDKALKRRHLYVVREDHWLTQAISDLLAVVRGTKSREDEFLRHMRLARYDIVRRTGLDVSQLSPDRAEEMERLEKEGVGTPAPLARPEAEEPSQTNDSEPDSAATQKETVGHDEGTVAREREGSLEAIPAGD